MSGARRPTAFWVIVFFLVLSIGLTAAVFGVSAYWAVTIAFVLLFAPGAAGYNYAPGFEIWFFVGAYAVCGVWGLFYLMRCGQALVE